MAAPADADTTTRSRIYIRSAMAEPAAYAHPTPAYRARLEAQWRREGRDPQALSRQFDIAMHNNSRLQPSAPSSTSSTALATLAENSDD
ncbi:hypothetical protein [Streptomyces sp. NPDC018711]|uniref:hypothetical protein n=1 Tax=Streptomyces sp. NPDC018711 TaxID=3365052 RepID=UPI00379BBEAF